jgi:serine-threonine kinase receptor-associated protein
VAKHDVAAAITSMELSADGSVLVVTYGQKVTFWEPNAMTLMKEVGVEAPVYTASRHPDGETFVWGGIDNLLHVVNYETGQQQEEYKGHFGPVHCVRYSPDGEIYASGSEDGTVRLWQSRVGLEYGLWRFDKAPDA